MMRILIHYSFTEDQIQALQQLAPRYGDHTAISVSSEAEAMREAPNIEVLLGHFSPAVCAAAPHLRWIQSFSAGMDSFLFPEVVESDVVITNMAGIYASQGGEHAWALLLALSRGIATAARSQGNKQWKGGAAIELTGGTMSIIGLGGFGIEIAKRAQGYNLTILAMDPVRRDKPDGIAELRPGSKEDLHYLLERADVVMLACPGTPQTYHLIGREELDRMKQTAYLVNVTRGGIIDETDLADALKRGQIAGAALDVFEEEPLPADSPLWDAPNLIITAHRAGSSQHRPREVFEFFYKNLERYLKGEDLLNRIDKKRGF